MLISHEQNDFQFEQIVMRIRQQFKESGSEELEEKITLLHQLSDFELGRFLLSNKGLNGYWTSYVILKAIKKNNLSELEHWLVHEAPGFKATRERFHIFQQQAKNYLSDNINIASIPCGLMDDLMTLDYNNYKNIRLTGIDLDLDSLKLSQKNAQNYQIDNVEFKQKNAWALDEENQFDLLLSNGLNIYEGDEEKLIKLYQNFYLALKPGGILITSFITPSPERTITSPWKKVDMAAAKKQQIIFGDIIQANWQHPLLEPEVIKQIEAAGFSITEVIYDSQGIFPTIIAQKAPHSD